MYYYHVCDYGANRGPYIMTPLRKATTLENAIKGARVLISRKGEEFTGVILKASSENALIPKDIEYRIDRDEYPYLSKCIVGYVNLDEPYGTAKRIYTYNPKNSKKFYRIDKNGKLIR